MEIVDRPKYNLFVFTDHRAIQVYRSQAASQEFESRHPHKQRLLLSGTFKKEESRLGNKYIQRG